MFNNIIIIAEGEVKTPEGKSKKVSYIFPVGQILTAHSFKILKSKDPYEEYRKTYGDVGLRVKKWIRRHRQDGLKIEWKNI